MRVKGIIAPPDLVPISFNSLIIPLIAVLISSDKITTDIVLSSPEADAAAHSQQLCELIRNRIKASGGQIGFDEFMQMALYEPGLGYYVSGARKFGPAGDFITAPEIGDLFGRCIARQCQQVLKITGGSILEFGAGSGVLATQILDELSRLDSLPEHYFILEVSPDLRQRQRELIDKTISDFSSRVTWIDSLPESFDGVIVANEVLDAMPVVRFRVGEKEIEEMKVMSDSDNFVSQYVAPSNEKRGGDTSVIRSLQLEREYESEVNYHAIAWVKTVAQCLHNGVILLIDYGFPRSEYFHPDRSQGTLMCHYQHRAHENPFINIGLQDITAHIDYTALAESADDARLDVLGYTTQAAFLMSLGILDFVDAESGSTVHHLMQTNQIKKLTMPSEMGELFKVMALGKGIDQPLQGFNMSDRRAHL